jgi:hypothetical protein
MRRDGGIFWWRSNFRVWRAPVADRAMDRLPSQPKPSGLDGHYLVADILLRFRLYNDPAEWISRGAAI